MAAAYSAFGNGGYYTKPYSYTKIEYTADKKEVENKNEKNQVMKDSTAYMISDMLVDTGQYALGRWANINGKVYAAKTGTTNYDEKTKSAFGLPGSAVNDLWVVGFNNEYAIGVWYGYDKNSSEYYNLLSSGQHERLFQAVGRGMFTSDGGFTKPSSVSEVAVETECPTPMLPSEFTPSDLIKTELFVKGHEPTETSPRFAKLPDTTSVKATESKGTVTLSWSAVNVPEINTDSFLRNYLKETFKSTEYLNSFVAGRLNYINSTMGSFGYNIYRQDGTFLGFTNQTSYTLNATNGNQTYIVKTAYSNFRATESAGKSVSVTVSGASSGTDKDKEKEKESDKEDKTDTVEPTCPTGYTFDKTEGKCYNDDKSSEANPTCNTGYTFDSSSKTCKKN